MTFPSPAKNSAGGGQDNRSNQGPAFTSFRRYSLQDPQKSFLVLRATPILTLTLSISGSGRSPRPYRIIAWGWFYLPSKTRAAKSPPARTNPLPFLTNPLPILPANRNYPSWRHSETSSAAAACHLPGIHFRLVEKAGIGLCPGRSRRDAKRRKGLPRSGILATAS